MSPPSHPFAPCEPHHDDSFKTKIVVLIDDCSKIETVSLTDDISLTETIGLTDDSFMIKITWMVDVQLPTITLTQS